MKVEGGKGKTRKERVERYWSRVCVERNGEVTLVEGGREGGRVVDTEARNTNTGGKGWVESGVEGTLR